MSVLPGCMYYPYTICMPVAHRDQKKMLDLNIERFFIFTYFIIQRQGKGCK